MDDKTGNKTLNSKHIDTLDMTEQSQTAQEIIDAGYFPHPSCELGKNARQIAEENADVIKDWLTTRTGKEG